MKRVQPSVYQSAKSMCLLEDEELKKLKRKTTASHSHLTMSQSGYSVDGSDDIKLFLREHLNVTAASEWHNDMVLLQLRP